MTQLRNTIITDWCPSLPSAEQHLLASQLEAGDVLYFPALPFELLNTERRFVEEDMTGMQSKNVSVNPSTSQLKGIHCSAETTQALTQLCLRYHQQVATLLHTLFPFYTAHLLQGMTSFRPIEIKGRIPASYKKDDTRLHIDAFPSRPNQGKRILRVFTNVNPHNKPRVWRLGDPFDVVAQRFMSRLRYPWRFVNTCRQLAGVTKGYRTAYDSVMLQLHDAMKADMTYQRAIDYTEVAFPPGSTWIVMTDCVSHAVLSGQHLLEQTFYLPVSAMRAPAVSPLHILQNLSGRTLV